MTQAKSTKKLHLNKKSCNFVSFFFSRNFRDSPNSENFINISDVMIHFLYKAVGPVPVGVVLPEVTVDPAPEAGTETNISAVGPRVF